MQRSFYSFLFYLKKKLLFRKEAMEAQEKINIVKFGFLKYYYKIVLKTYKTLERKCNLFSENDYSIEITKK